MILYKFMLGAGVVHVGGSVGDSVGDPRLARCVHAGAGWGLCLVKHVPRVVVHFWLDFWSIFGSVLSSFLV